MSHGDEREPRQAGGREPLPRWKRLLSRSRFAIDYLRGPLVRYRPFDKVKDLDEAQPGYLADTLATGRIFVPAAESLNDPWEASPSIEPVWWERDKHRAIADFLAFLAPQLNTPERYQQLLEETRAHDSGEILRRAREILLQYLRRSPILSLSKRADSFLMWSHYAQGHTGYALAFDPKVLPFSAAVRVRYSRLHPKITLNRRDMRGIVLDVLATKARSWSYEREWRVLISAENAKKIGYLDFKKASSVGYYGIVPRASLKGVIVGDRLYRGPYWKDFLSLVAQYAPPLELWLAEIDQRAFRIVLRPIKVES